jgi:hypothetical protein
MPPAPPAGAGFSPLDVELALLPKQRRTPRLEEMLARFGTGHDFAAAADQFTFVTGVPVSEATARRRTYAAGGAALAQEEAELAQIERDLPAPPVTPERMQLSVDATTVPLVGGAWTEVKLAAFADLREPKDADEDGPVVEATALSYAGRWEEAGAFGRTVTLEAHRRGLSVAAEVASPNDGAKWIQDIVDLVAPQAVHILDEPHGAEHLGISGTLVFGPDNTQARQWVDEQRDQVLYGSPSEVLPELARCQMRGPCPRAPQGPDGLSPADWLAREVAYFHSRADQIEYQAFRRARYPIGSGIVESGHDVVVTPRFKGAGQHWATHHLNPLLVLRTILCSDRWVATWPALWQQAVDCGATRRRAAGSRRRTVWEAARAAAASPAVPAAPPPALPTSPPLVVAPAPTPRAPRSRRPAPDHPWRRPFLAPARRAG